jgi:predicted HD superfamily hydrolase involved in NAD metabolism
MHRNIEKRIFDYLSGHLSPERFEHSCSVASLAAELALTYGADVLKAQTAGLLHDCAKYMTDVEFIDFLDRHGKFLKCFGDIIKFPSCLLHSFTGRIIAEEEFGIKDRDILNAVRNHTLGRKNMSVLEKIIFIADFVSHGRKCKHAVRIRSLEDKNLNKVFLEIFAEKIKYVVNSRVRLCPQTVDIWNWYVSNNEK